MAGPEFFQTGMGRKFYESDVPRIAKALERIATALEARNKKEADEQNRKQEAEPVQVQVGTTNNEDARGSAR